MHRLDRTYPDRDATASTDRTRELIFQQCIHCRLQNLRPGRHHYPEEQTA